MAKRKKQYYLLPMDYLRKLGRVPEGAGVNEHGIFIGTTMKLDCKNSEGPIEVERVVLVGKHIYLQCRLGLGIPWIIPRNWLVYR